MKQVTGILMLMIYLAGMLRPVLPYVEYAINQKHIAAEHCINKDKPELKCNGQCYLMQQLKAMQADVGGDSPIEVPPVLSLEEILSAHLVDPYALCPLLPEQQVSYFPEKKAHLLDVSLSIPTPPSPNLIGSIFFRLLLANMPDFQHV